MIRARLEYSELIALGDRLNRDGAIYTAPEAGVSPFSVWVSPVGEPTRLFVASSETMPATFAADFPRAIRADTVSV